LTPADGVFTKREPLRVRRNVELADLIVVMPHTEFVGIQHHLFRRIE